MLKTKLSLFMVLTPLALIATAASATTYVMMSDEQLLDRSPLVVEGRVEQVRSAPTETPNTDYRVRVLEVLKGPARPGERLLVRVLGGIGRSGLALRVWGAPTFASGDRVLLFLRPNPDGTVGIEQLIFGGFRRVVHDGKVIAWRNLNEANELGAAEKRQDQLRDYHRFRSWIRDRAAQRNTSAGHYRLEPNDWGGPEFAFMQTTPGQCGDATPVPIRWFVFPSSVAIAALQGGQPGLAGGGFTEVQNALAAWTGDPNSNISYVYGGTTASTAQCNNSIVFGDPDNAIPGTFGGSGTVAIGGPCFSCAVQSYNAASFHPTNSAFVITQDGIDSIFAGASGPTKAEELFAHELGHTLGLGHTGVANSLMNPALHNPPIGASFSSDDLAGIQALYGTGGSSGAPAAPSNLAATPVSSTQINLAWSDASTNETSFRIERFNGSVFVEIGSTGVNQNSFADTGRSPSTLYTYRVRARNGTGDSGYSNQDSATTFAAAFPPSAPASLVATALSSSSIQLTWTDTSSDETSFRVEQLVGFSFFEIAFTGAGQNSHVVTGLSPATNSTFRVKARNGNGDSGYSNEASATTLPAGGSPPAAPTNLAANALSPTSVQLAWTDNATNETNYLAEIDPTVNGLDDFQQLLPLLSANSTGATVSNLLAATPYRFRVKALSDNGESPYSNVAQATTLPASGAVPSAPTNLATVALSPASIQLTWTDTSDNEDSFRVEREIFGSFIEIGSTPAGQAAFTDNGLSPSTLYTYRVRSRNGNGDSAYSSTASATTPPGGGGPTSPAAPEGLAAIALANGHIVLTWADRANNEESFVVEHEEAAGFQTLLTLGANQQFADIPGLAAGRVHRFRVKARNAAGDSPYSNIAAAALPVPAPPAGAWLETAEIRGFRFKTRIDGDGEGTQVLDCVPDTLCVAGAIPSRTEVFLRVIGPRPNNKLWAQVVRFTVSRVEVWIEQIPGGTLRYYDLAALPASTTALGGLNDSEAFSPAENGAFAVDRLRFEDLSVLRWSPAVALQDEGWEANPAPPAGDWLTTPELAGFRFKARIGEGSSQRSGTKVLDCVPQTLCVAGALPDRTELFVRIIGPRPNGFLWAQFVRFTVASLELWVEQEGTLLMRYYTLPGLSAATTELPGRNDSQAFVP